MMLDLVEEQNKILKEIAKNFIKLDNILKIVQDINKNFEILFEKKPTEL